MRQSEIGGTRVLGFLEEVRFGEQKETPSRCGRAQWTRVRDY